MSIVTKLVKFIFIFLLFIKHNYDVLFENEIYFLQSEVRSFYVVCLFPTKDLRYLMSRMGRLFTIIIYKC